MTVILETAVQGQQQAEDRTTRSAITPQKRGFAVDKSNVKADELGNAKGSEAAKQDESPAKRRRTDEAPLAAAAAPKQQKKRSVEKSNVMKGDLYNKGSVAQQLAHAVAYPMVDACLKRTCQGFKDAAALEICDLGCASGVNAVSFGGRALKILRELGDKRPVRYSMVDLPTNDWNALAGRLKEESAFAPENGVFTSKLGADFYGPCAPAGSVHISVSMICPHWMSAEKPPPPVGAPAGAEPATLVGLEHTIPSTPSVPPAVRGAFEAKAHADLVCFLRQRARELVPGGEGIYVMVGAFDNHRPEYMFSYLHEYGMERAIKKGTVRPEVLKRMSINYFTRTEEEIKRAAAEVEDLEVMGLDSLILDHGAPLPLGSAELADVVGSLFWSIHEGSIRASTGCTDAESAAIKAEVMKLVEERCKVQYIQTTYRALHVRKTS